MPKIRTAYTDEMILDLTDGRVAFRPGWPVAEEEITEMIGPGWRFRANIPGALYGQWFAAPEKSAEIIATYREHMPDEANKRNPHGGSDIHIIAFHYERRDPGGDDATN